jgi:LysM repeat protein
MKIIFKDKNTELVLPVTPENYDVPDGINVEIVNIHTLGDVALPGHSVLPTLKINCMFPAKDYPFNQPGTVTDPFYYVDKFAEWSLNRTVLRYIIHPTKINIPVLVQSIISGEQDGTGDVYATIELRKYRELSAVQTEKTGNKSRSVDAPDVTAQTYTVQSGDTLSAISRKFYGDASLYQKLADYNGIKNPNLIYVGNIIKLPDRSQL